MITDFGIKNFRSFDGEGAFLDGLQKINIFIGKNNSGKSNFLRFLSLLSNHTNDHEKFPSSVYENIHRGCDNTTILTLICTHDEISIPEKVHYNSEDFYLTTYLPNPFKVDFTLIYEQNKSISLPQLDNEIPIDVLRKIQKQNVNNDKEGQINQLKVTVYHKILDKLKAFREVIYISDFRLIQEGNKFESSNSELNGSNIISKMFEMQNPDTGKEQERNKFNKIQKTVRELLGIEDLNIEIPHSKDKIILSIHDGIRQPLSSFGTGIHQLIILCSALIIYSNKIICIEEPEIHLHPELQRKFLDFLIRDTENMYFITTHSNTFLNLRENISIYHIANNGKASKSERVDNSENSYRLLDDLGYKASDLLQSNGIIWVEGPSDRNFINRWISLIAPSLEEGLHYVIMFYGGRLLANCSFDTAFFENNLIPLLRINRNAFVLIDRDSKQINKTKTRINNEIGDDNCWITNGKEIENYIANDVIKKWLVSKSAYNGEIINQGAEQKFSDIIECLDSTKKIKYDLYKNAFSTEICAFFEDEDLNYTDLKKRVEQLVKKISQWNLMAINC
ncbi:MULTISPECIES: ATP-binding protein [unclassified Mucilaginibacter]|uniref:ATP-dependent nuclease n=1 Tax=unclassified Mucilaginibacter TaxID=2617802 RepID=UPI002AC91E67|nr:MULTISPECIES: ATP-binding protein [unclassified Mucilaginibacter]MEB0280808.1 ATP-binding protein [Mucilaginibacter sp. 10B2]MEB0302264.1 ATP-binding protein [Mucilaginibacter sp. 5C4]WPX25674.1 ATP-binding protein [Mucilaginibacter sp. 5C4]